MYLGLLDQLRLDDQTIGVVRQRAGCSRLSGLFNTGFFPKKNP